MTLDLELVIICTDEVLVYCCCVYKMHDRDQLCVFFNYCLLSCGHIQRFKFCAIVVTS